jgi:uncharacterized SAM-binding protein YcdF (DUF218 family)
VQNSYPNRDRIIDYIAPESVLFRCEYALLFGSRHAQEPLATEASQLFNRGFFEKLIVCGGATQSLEATEASQMSAKLVGVGIPASAILIEARSMNTGENVRFARELIGDDISEILLLGKLYAKRRYVMTMKAQWKSVYRIACHGINYFGVTRAEWWKSPELRSLVLAELRKIPRYLELGYIEEIEVVDGQFI